MNDNAYKSPIAALLWATVFCGFGQLYNRDYVIAIILMIWEVVVNVLAHLNLSYYLALNFHLHESMAVANFEWGMFYPSIYAFTIFQAYNRAQEINRKLRQEEVPEPEQKVKGLGVLYGLGIGMNLGLAWSSLLQSPVYSGLALALVGALIGGFIEKVSKHFHKPSEGGSL